ncbi:MAG: Hpt domain-containing protein, partial [Pseudomonadota bacterium]
MTIDMSQFFQVFFDEAEELLAEKERLLLAVDVSAPDPEDLNAIFRTAHSIKGGAATFGLTDMTEVTHILESLLDKIRKGEMALTSEHVDAFLAAKDILKMQLDGHRLGSVVDHDAVADVRMMLQSLSLESVSKAPVVAPIAIAAQNPIPKPVLFADLRHRFHIELPALSERDINALVLELGLLGEITTSQLPDQRYLLAMSTDENVDAIIAICSFILNPSDLKISELAVVTNSQRAFAQAEKNKIEEEQGYGFFEPIDAPNSDGLTDDERGYGFFDPIEVSPTDDSTDEKRGYGFFQPLEQIRAAAAKASAAGIRSPSVTPNTDSVSEEAPNSLEEKKPVVKRDASAQESSSIRVSIEKVDQLINLVGE